MAGWNSTLSPGRPPQRRERMRPGCGHKRYPDPLSAQIALAHARTPRETRFHEACGGYHNVPPAAGLRSASTKSAPPEPRQPGQAPKENGLQAFPRRNAKLIDTRDVDPLNDERCCQRCGSTANLERQHRRGKDMGGSANRAHTHCPCNGLVLCGAGPGSLNCHGWSHAHPEQAEAEGLVVSQAVDWPGSVGVLRFAAADGVAARRQWPSCDGRWAETAPEAREAA